MNDSREDNTQVKKWQQEEAWQRLFEDNIEVKKWQQEAWRRLFDQHRECNNGREPTVLESEEHLRIIVHQDLGGEGTNEDEDAEEDEEDIEEIKMQIEALQLKKEPDQRLASAMSLLTYNQHIEADDAAKADEHLGEDIEEEPEDEDPLTGSPQKSQSNAWQCHRPIPTCPSQRGRREESRKMQQVGGEEDSRRSSMESDESAKIYYLKKMQQEMETRAQHKDCSKSPKRYVMCRYFEMNGCCWWGENCYFSHDPMFRELAIEEWPPGLCKNFTRNGRCRREEMCHYIHDGEERWEKKLAEDEARQDKRMECTTIAVQLKQRFGQIHIDEEMQQHHEKKARSSQQIGGILQALPERVPPWKKRKKKAS